MTTPAPDQAPNQDPNPDPDRTPNQSIDQTTSTDREDRLQQRIADAKVEGWSVKERNGDQVILKKTSNGSWMIHAALLLFTMGIGNVFYWLYARSSDQRVVRP
jgi:hypothetical protein